MSATNQIILGGASHNDFIFFLHFVHKGMGQIVNNFFFNENQQHFIFFTENQFFFNFVQNNPTPLGIKWSTYKYGHIITDYSNEFGGINN